MTNTVKRVVELELGVLAYAGSARTGMCLVADAAWNDWHELPEQSLAHPADGHSLWLRWRGWILLGVALILLAGALALWLTEPSAELLIPSAGALPHAASAAQ